MATISLESDKLFKDLEDGIKFGDLSQVGESLNNILGSDYLHRLNARYIAVVSDNHTTMYSPLEFASSLGNIEIIRELMSYGSKVTSFSIYLAKSEEVKSLLSLTQMIDRRTKSLLRF